MYKQIQRPPVRRMAEGGIASAMSMMNGPGAADPEMQGAADQAMSRGIDPNVLGQLVEGAAGTIQELDMATEAGDFEAAMNAIRGDVAPIEARREELAGVVGPEDAGRTPDSVLTLVQPVMQMAAIDQGIGEAAQGAMGTPVDGPMTEGIMSTVNLAPPAPPGPRPTGQSQPMPGPGGPAPVNFRQGGAVAAPARFAEGGPALDPEMARLFEQQQALYGQIYGAEDREADLEARRQAARSQLFFDIARGGLAMAAPSPSGKNMSFVSKLGEAFGPVAESVRDRVGALSDFEAQQAAEGRQIDLLALQSAQQMFRQQQEDALRAAEIAASGRASGAEEIGDLYRITDTRDPENPVVISQNTTLTADRLRSLEETFGENGFLVEKLGSASAPQSAENFLLDDGSVVAAVPGTARYDTLVAANAPVVGTGDVLSASMPERTQVTLNKDVTINGRRYFAGSSPNFTDRELNIIANEFGAEAYSDYERPASDRDYFNRFGMTKAEFDGLTQDQRNGLLNIGISDRDYFNRFGMLRSEFESLNVDDRKVLLGIEPEYRFEKIEDGDQVRLIRINVRDPDDVVDIMSADVLSPPSYMRVTTADGVSQVVDVSTRQGREAVAVANQQNARDPGSARIEKVGTESVTAKPYLIPDNPDTEEIEGGVFMSYDNGRTYTDENGQARSIVDEGGFEISPMVAADIYKSNQISREAAEDLAAARAEDERLTSLIGTQEAREELERALVSAQLGTGPYSKIYAGINAVAGGLIAPEYFQDLFRENEAARQYIRQIRILGRAALTVNPRFAVTELEAVEGLFPSEQDFLRNPEDSVDKMISLASTIDRQYQAILTALSEGVSDQTLRSELIAKQYQLEIVKDMLGPIHVLQGTSRPLETVEGGLSPDQLEQTRGLIGNGGDASDGPTLLDMGEQ